MLDPWKVGPRNGTKINERRAGSGFILNLFHGKKTFRTKERVRIKREHTGGKQRDASGHEKKVIDMEKGNCRKFGRERRKKGLDREEI